jgi:hypothetical protein
MEVVIAPDSLHPGGRRAVCSPPVPGEMGYIDAASPASETPVQNEGKKRVREVVACPGWVIFGSTHGWVFNIDWIGFRRMLI